MMQIPEDDLRKLITEIQDTQYPSPIMIPYKFGKVEILHALLAKYGENPYTGPIAGFKVPEDFKSEIDRSKIVDSNGNIDHIKLIEEINKIGEREGKRKLAGYYKDVDGENSAAE